MAAGDCGVASPVAFSELPHGERGTGKLLAGVEELVLTILDNGAKFEQQQQQQQRLW